jgi:hypothetical protein
MRRRANRDSGNCPLLIEKHDAVRANCSSEVLTRTILTQDPCADQWIEHVPSKMRNHGDAPTGTTINQAAGHFTHRSCARDCCLSYRLDVQHAQIAR